MPFDERKKSAKTCQKLNEIDDTINRDYMQPHVSVPLVENQPSVMVPANDVSNPNSDGEIEDATQLGIFANDGSQGLSTTDSSIQVNATRTLSHQEILQATAARTSSSIAMMKALIEKNFETLTSDMEVNFENLANAFHDLWVSNHESN